MSERSIDQVEELVAKNEALQRELIAAQEMLYLVLDEIGEPVRIHAASAKDRIRNDRIIDAELVEGFWVFQTKELTDGQ